MLRPTHSQRHDNSDYIMQFSAPLPVAVSFFGPNIVLSTLFPNVLILCSSLNVRDQVSHPCRTTDKIIVVYIHIFMFFDNRWDTRVLDRMIASITRIRSRRNLFLTCCCRSQMFELWHMIKCSVRWFWPATYVLVTIKVSVFFFVVYVLLLSRFTSWA
jgi:hypothetical protein